MTKSRKMTQGNWCACTFKRKERLRMYLYKKQRQNDKQTNSRNVSSMVSKVEKEGKKVLQKCTISACVPSTHSEYPQIQMEHYILNKNRSKNSEQ